jgi:AcrR family transcriptional regulator
MGIKPPSVYKYFPSLHAIYDGLFARGNARLARYVDEAVDELEPGLPRLLERNRAFLRWSMLNRGLAVLLFWRPIPGFEPSPESYALAEELATRARADLCEAARKGDLDESADSEEAFRMLTTLGAGIASQQLANEPGATYETGVFTSLTERALDMFVQQYAPRRSRGTSPTSPRRNR